MPEEEKLKERTVRAIVRDQPGCTIKEINSKFSFVFLFSVHFYMCITTCTIFFVFSDFYRDVTGQYIAPSKVMAEFQLKHMSSIQYADDKYFIKNWSVL